MKTVICLALGLICIPAIGQTAKVIAISPVDAVTAKDLYTQQAELKKKIDAFNKHVLETYVDTQKCAGNGFILGSTETIVSVPENCHKAGWESGEFEFSDDFKYIVPKSVIISSGGSGFITSNCGL